MMTLAARRALVPLSVCTNGFVCIRIFLNYLEVSLNFFCPSRFSSFGDSVTILVEVFILAQSNWLKANLFDNIMLALFRI